MKKGFLAITLLIFVFVSCGKDSTGGGGTNLPPSNLVVTATVSTDNSGNVSFTATATNATTYRF